MQFTPLQKKRIEKALSMVDKDLGELIVHILELEEKYEDAQSVYKELNDKCAQLFPIIEKVNSDISSITPIKGEDYFTKEEIELIQQEVLNRIPAPQTIDEEKLAKKIIAVVTDSITKSIKVPKDGQDAIVDYDFIITQASAQITEQVLAQLPKPEPAKELTPSDLKQLLSELPEEEKIGVDELKPSAKYITHDVLNRAIEILDSRTRFLINKQTASIADAGNIIDNEVPTGTINGVNTEFTLSQAPSPANSLKVYINGVRLTVTEDYTLSGTTLTFLVAPETGSLINCDYRYA